MFLSIFQALLLALQPILVVEGVKALLLQHLHLLLAPRAANHTAAQVFEGVARDEPRGARRPGDVGHVARVGPRHVFHPTEAGLGDQLQAAEAGLRKKWTDLVRVFYLKIYISY